MQAALGGEAGSPLPGVQEYKQTKEGTLALPYESGHEHRFFHRLARGDHYLGDGSALIRTLPETCFKGIAGGMLGFEG